MAMSGFICHDDYYERLQRLTDEEVGHLFRNLMLYHAGKIDDITDFVGCEGIAFDFIKDDIDRMEEKHNATSETNRINGLKGGRPRKQKEPEETEKNPTKPTETEVKQLKAYKDKDKDKNKNTTPLFDRFWSAYPRHVNKQGAIRAFEKAKVDEELLMVILNAIEKQKGSDQWTKDNGQFIPHPATWLNGKRWEDEVVTGTGKKAVNAQQYEQRNYSDEDDEAMKRMLQAMQEGA